MKEKKEAPATAQASQELINEQKTHDLLGNLISKGVLELKPSLEKSGIRYFDIENVLGTADLPAAKGVLDDLTKKGMLKSKIANRVLLCPNCSSPEVHSKFHCPRCDSENVMLTELIEHKTCGYIGARSDFLRGNKLICPRCSTDLTNQPAAYKIIGNFYQCDNCGNRFDKPEVVHICQNCGTTSTFQQVKYVKVFSYRIDDDVVQKFSEELPILDNIKRFLEKKGLTVKLHSEITGISGVPSKFAVIAEKAQTRVVIDVSLEGEKNDIVALLAKKMDVTPTKILLLDLSGGKELEGLGKIYGIDVVSATADQDVPKDVEALLNDV
ncbi:MAG: hypothetical protein NWF04_01025 [Candidatus Bathyarchaeota archaeon]|nr:hypothetical protein [Candidatus Bathyarchaeota archaeon]